MRGVVKFLVLAACLAGVTAVASPPAAVAATHDGQWSVLVITEKGTCDRGYRYSVRVRDGRLAYDGEAGVDMAGTVTPAGQVQVRIRLGNQGANGSGRLSGAAGAGTWRGAGSSGECSGRWEAERR